MVNYLKIHSLEGTSLPVFARSLILEDTKMEYYIYNSCNDYSVEYERTIYCDSPAEVRAYLRTNLNCKTVEENGKPYGEPNYLGFNEYAELVYEAWFNKY